MGDDVQESAVDHSDRDLDTCPECGMDAVVVWAPGVQCDNCGAIL